MAQDGRIYEKAAIEDWFAKKQGQPIKSPVTNEPMGRTLIASTQARNAIRNMVESGALSGAKADAPEPVTPGLGKAESPGAAPQSLQLHTQHIGTPPPPDARALLHPARSQRGSPAPRCRRACG